MELDTIAAMIRIVPWQGELVPHFMLMTREERDDREKVTVMELAALQEGLYQAANKVDEMIHCLFDEIREEKMQEFLNDPRINPVSLNLNYKKIVDPEALEEDYKDLVKFLKEKFNDKNN